VNGRRKGIPAVPATAFTPSSRLAEDKACTLCHIEGRNRRVPQVSLLRPGIPQTNAHWKHPPSSLSDGEGLPLPLTQALSVEKPPFPPATALSLQLPSPFCHPERTRISCCTALIGDPGCGSLQREPHAPDRSRNSRQEIRGSRGICGAPFGCPKFPGLQPTDRNSALGLRLLAPFVRG
jgi:hypothetical protein